MVDLVGQRSRMEPPGKPDGRAILLGRDRFIVKKSEMSESRRRYLKPRLSKVRIPAARRIAERNSRGKRGEVRRYGLLGAESAWPFPRPLRTLRDETTGVKQTKSVGEES